MNRLNSFIFNFDRSSTLTTLWVTLWAGIGLVIIDILINLVFAYPAAPQVTNPSQLRLYFEYGRSSEAKLARMTRADPSETAPITLAGWYDPLRVEDFPTTSQQSIVTFYGMSHAVRLGLALKRTSNRFSPRIIGAPGATTNWSYGAYLRDRGGGKSKAVVLALMSVNLPMITTVSPMTWNIDFPMPYTADRFYVDNRELRVVHPPFSSFEQYIQAFTDPKKWSAALDFFAKNDSMYNPFIMKANVLDHSALFRLLRRAYGQRFLRSEQTKVLDQNGFHSESDQIQVARALVRDFAKRARSDGVIPVIFLVNNFGYSDYLYQALRITLEADKIPFLSSHTIVSPSDPRGYLPDSHFTDLIDDKLARALVELIDRQ